MFTGIHRKFTGAHRNVNRISPDVHQNFELERLKKEDKHNSAFPHGPASLFLNPRAVPGFPAAPNNNHNKHNNNNNNNNNNNDNNDNNDNDDNDK